MFIGISLVVQWLRLCTSTAGSVGSIPGQGNKIPLAAKKIIRCSQKKKKQCLSFQSFCGSGIQAWPRWVSHRQCSRCYLGLQVSQSTSWGTFRVGGPLPSSLTWLLAEFVPSQAMDQKPTLSSLPCEAPHHGSVLQQSILAQKRKSPSFVT